MDEYPKEGGVVASKPNSILIVDDTVANLLAYSAILKRLHCRIVIAGSGAEALRCTLEEDFKVILLDIRMPDMNGFETAEHLRKRPGSRETPILFLSAYDTPPLHVFSKFVGGQMDFLSCPVDAETLLLKVGLYLKSAGAEEQADPSDPKLQKAGEKEEGGISG
jgi:CheY-like chemotaxis protein